ncbi:MAG: ester cyclase [Planctomycetota bacterium]
MSDVGLTATQVFRSWFERVWNQKDASAMQDLFHEDGVAHGLGPEPIRGPEGFRAVWEAFQTTFDDIRIEVLDTLELGDRVYGRCRAVGSAGGKPVSFEGGALCTVRDGKLFEAHNCWDFLGAMVRSGSLPEDAFLRSCTGERFAS